MRLKSKWILFSLSASWNEHIFKSLMVHFSRHFTIYIHIQTVQESIQSVQFSSVTWLCPALCDPVDCSTPGFPVHYQLLEPTQTYVHWAGDAIQLSHPLSSPSPHLSSPSPPAFNLSQQQGLFQWVNSSHQMAKVLKFQLQHQSCQWIFRTDFL